MSSKSPGPKNANAPAYLLGVKLFLPVDNLIVYLPPVRGSWFQSQEYISLNLVVK